MKVVLWRRVCRLPVAQAAPVLQSGDPWLETSSGTRQPTFSVKRGRSKVDSSSCVAASILSLFDASCDSDSPLREFSDDSVDSKTAKRTLKDVFAAHFLPLRIANDHNSATDEGVNSLTTEEASRSYS